MKNKYQQESKEQIH